MQLLMVLSTSFQLTCTRMVVFNIIPAIGLQYTFKSFYWISTLPPILIILALAPAHVFYIDSLYLNKTPK